MHPLVSGFTRWTAVAAAAAFPAFASPASSAASATDAGAHAGTSSSANAAASPDVGAATSSFVRAATPDTIRASGKGVQLVCVNDAGNVTRTAQAPAGFTFGPTRTADVQKIFGVFAFPCRIVAPPPAASVFSRIADNPGGSTQEAAWNAGTRKLNDTVDQIVVKYVPAQNGRPGFWIADQADFPTGYGYRLGSDGRLYANGKPVSGREYADLGPL